MKVVVALCKLCATVEEARSRQNKETWSLTVGIARSSIMAKYIPFVFPSANVVHAIYCHDDEIAR